MKIEESFWGFRGGEKEIAGVVDQFVYDVGRIPGLDVMVLLAIALAWSWAQHHRENLSSKGKSSRYCSFSRSFDVRFHKKATSSLDKRRSRSSGIFACHAMTCGEERKTGTRQDSMIRRKERIVRTCKGGGDLVFELRTCGEFRGCVGKVPCPWDWGRSPLY